MSKYTPLKRYLQKASGTVELSFADIEHVLGFSLPKSARLYPAWWSNSSGTHVQSAAWLEAGYETQRVDLVHKSIHFVPAPKSGLGEMQQADFAAAATSPPDKHPLFGCMKGTSIVMPGVDLTEPADPDWGKVYDDDYEDDFFPAEKSDDK